MRRYGTKLEGDPCRCERIRWLLWCEIVMNVPAPSEDQTNEEQIKFGEYRYQ
jgi:hypothetical protein